MTNILFDGFGTSHIQMLLHDELYKNGKGPKKVPIFSVFSEKEKYLLKRTVDKALDVINLAYLHAGENLIFYADTVQLWFGSSSENFINHIDGCIKSLHKIFQKDDETFITYR